MTFNNVYGTNLWNVKFQISHLVRFRLMNHAGGKLPTTDREHKMILQALRKRDPEKEKQAIRDHLLRIEAACAANPQQ